MRTARLAERCFAGKPTLQLSQDQPWPRFRPEADIRLKACLLVSSGKAVEDIHLPQLSRRIGWIRFALSSRRTQTLKSRPEISLSEVEGKQNAAGHRCQSA